MELISPFMSYRRPANFFMTRPTKQEWRLSPQLPHLKLELTIWVWIAMGVTETFSNRYAVPG